MKNTKRIYLSPPHMSGNEIRYVQDAFASNWIAPVGPDIHAFEQAVCNYTGASHAVALSSGTAAIHLALLASGVGNNDDVYCSTFTFAGSIFPVAYCGANVILIDSEKKSWNMDPLLLSEAIEKSKKSGRIPKAVILVHLYGQSADTSRIREICDQEKMILIEDAAESLGAFHHDCHTGIIGDFGIFSFNGNKIITTSGGGMLVGKNSSEIEKAKFLSIQAREPLPYYQHLNIGYNYRMSNILAAIGRGQMEVIEERVRRRREIFDLYSKALITIEGVSMMPVDCYGRSNCWLTCIIIDSAVLRKTPEDLRIALETYNIEGRPLWKPMHLQPIFQTYPVFSNGVSEALFKQGLCLPSGTSMSDSEVERVVSVVKNVL
jgi:pyridoxal phosphate-dependent aminotransferase EpsN